MHMGLNDGADDQAATAAFIQANVWYQFLIQKSGTTGKLYVGRVGIDSVMTERASIANLATLVPVGYDLWIGRRGYAPTPLWQALQIDELKVRVGGTQSLTMIPAPFGSSSIAEVPWSIAGRALLDDADSAAQRTTLGLTPTYANIYVADGTTAQAIATGTTYTKSTAFATNGASANCTAAAASDKITITEAGKYLVMFTVSTSTGTASTVVDSAIFYDGTEQNQVHATQKITNAGDVGTLTGTGIVTCAASKDIDLRFKHTDGGSVNFTVQDASITVQKIGP
jgi:hypothetical protein